MQEPGEKKPPPEEDLARTRRPDGKEVVDDTALGTWSTNPDYQRDDTAREKAREETDEEQPRE